jgi:hypothetical protein
MIDRTLSYWLQASGGYIDELLAGDGFQGIAGPFIDTVGIPMAALLFFGGIGVSYYANSGKAIMPVVMLILIGGVTMAYAPPSAARFGIIVLVLGITSIGYLAWRSARGGP